jgi:stage II sporulation protein P
MMVKLREWLVSGTFFSVICLISTIASVGWGLAANAHPNTYAAAEEEAASSDTWFLQAAAKTEMPVLGGLAALPAWDKLSGLYGGLIQASVDKPSERMLAASSTGQQAAPALAPSNPPSASSAKPDADKPVKTASVSPAFLIYHTHNRESYFPELKEGAKDPSSKTVNVTLVGKRLAASLEKLGMPAIHQTNDYPSTVQKFNYAYSYKYSKQTVVEALKKHKELTYLFDIHRDSQKRGKTTVEINGKDYAKILFVIGERNPHWKENKAFALKLHEALNAKYPGISRGVLSKGPGTGNAEYNQSLSPGSLVVEMGGVDNTLEESYRTADALAGVMKELVGETGGKRIAS